MPNFWQLATTPILKIQWLPLGKLIHRQKSFLFCTPPLENSTTCITIIPTFKEFWNPQYHSCSLTPSRQTRAFLMKQYATLKYARISDAKAKDASLCVKMRHFSIRHSIRNRARSHDFEFFSSCIRASIESFGKV